MTNLNIEGTICFILRLRPKGPFSHVWKRVEATQPVLWQTLSPSSSASVFQSARPFREVQVPQRLVVGSIELHSLAVRNCNCCDRSLYKFADLAVQTTAASSPFCCRAELLICAIAIWVSCETDFEARLIGKGGEVQFGATGMEMAFGIMDFLAVIQKSTRKKPHTT